MSDADVISQQACDRTSTFKGRMAAGLGTGLSALTHPSYPARESVVVATMPRDMQLPVTQIQLSQNREFDGGYPAQLSQNASPSVPLNTFPSGETDAALLISTPVAAERAHHSVSGNTGGFGGRLDSDNGRPRRPMHVPPMTGVVTLRVRRVTADLTGSPSPVKVETGPGFQVPVPVASPSRSQLSPSQRVSRRIAPALDDAQAANLSAAGASDPAVVADAASVPQIHF
jgi:hypothetical protein